MNLQGPTVGRMNLLGTDMRCVRQFQAKALRSSQYSCEVERCEDLGQLGQNEPASG
jgi:hypothetical protein